MDNLTHTLVGLLVGEAATHIAPQTGLPPPRKRSAFLGLMIVGSNLPDLDFIYSQISGSKLDYLLHHRGHTHTVIGAVLMACLMLFVCEGWLRRQHCIVSSRDRWQLAGVALLGPLVHIALDFTNSYGVHPFWPVWNGWLYGDSVFIVEPLLWSIAAPLVFLLRTRAARVIVALVIAAGVGLSFFSGLVPLAFAILLLAITTVLLLLGRYATARVALFSGIACWLMIDVSFFTASHVAGKRLSTIAATQFPSSKLLDHVLTPMPVNPLCWDVILVQANARDLFLRRATMSLVPSFIAADQCVPRSEATEISAPLRKMQQPNTDAIRWRGEVVTERKALQTLVATRCDAAAFMQFARAPWAAPATSDQPGASSEWLLGDLRFDREKSLAFAEFQLSRDIQCPRHVPPWSPPRADAL
jgi:inner membrane protein